MLKSNSAFTLMESVVAGVVFTIAVAGVFASLPAVKTRTVGTDKAFMAARCGQQILESMRAAVDGRDYDDVSSKLAIGNHVVNIASFDACNIAEILSASYVVSDGGGNRSRKVVATINY